jgi:hypothetical protein
MYFSVYWHEAGKGMALFLIAAAASLAKDHVTGVSPSIGLRKVVKTEKIPSFVVFPLPTVLILARGVDEKNLHTSYMHYLTSLQHHKATNTT